MTNFIKLVAFDLDGTTLPIMGTEVYPSFCEAMQRCSKLGVMFAIFTGRSLTTIPQNVTVQEGVQYLCYSNGAGIVEKASGSCIYTSPMPPEMALQTLEKLKRYDVVTQIFSDGRVIYPQRVLDNPERYDFPPHHMRAIQEGLSFGVADIPDYIRTQKPNIDKVNVMRVEGKIRDEMIADFTGTEGLDVVSSGGVNLEFNYYRTNKGLALLYLAEKLGLDMAQVMAIGDNDNDISMIKAAGLGVVMENGSQAAKEAADYITAAADDDGAALALRKFIEEVGGSR